MRTIRLIADYYSFPLWDNSGNLDPESVPISNILEQKLWEWEGKFDAILNMDDPPSSNFKDQEERCLFIYEGFILARDLKKELGENYEVEYWPLHLNENEISKKRERIVVVL